MLEAIIQEKLKGISREASDRNDKYRKCKQMLVVRNVLLASFQWSLKLDIQILLESTVCALCTLRL